MICRECQRSLSRESFAFMARVCRRCTNAKERRRSVRFQRAGLCACSTEDDQRVPPPGYRSCNVCLARARRRTGSKPWRPGGRGRPPGRLLDVRGGGQRATA